jgi:branched-chain amino acid aminotransferase
MELARHELGLEIEERAVDRSELYVCDELFLTGTAVGVAPVVRVDHRPVANGAIGPMTRSLRQIYFLATHGHLPAYRRWLIPVYAGSGPREQNAAHPAATSVA